MNRTPIGTRRTYEILGQPQGLKQQFLLAPVTTSSDCQTSNAKEERGRGKMEPQVDAQSEEAQGAQEEQ
jgi:hypothetical protein